MKFKSVVLAFALLLCGISAFAQAPAVVQQSATTLDSATQVTTSATSAATLTLAPQAGQFVYIDAVEFDNCAGASAVTAAAPTSVTTTNLTGGPSWLMASGVTAGLCAQARFVSFPKSLKSTTSGTNVTFVLPTFATNQTIRFSVYWRSAN